MYITTVSNDRVFLIIRKRNDIAFFIQKPRGVSHLNNIGITTEETC